MHGVPMTIKDSFNAAGLHTTWGNPAFRDFVADSDATIVQRHPAGSVRIVGPFGVLRWDGFSWHHEPPARTWIGSHRGSSLRYT